MARRLMAHREPYAAGAVCQGKLQYEEPAWPEEGEAAEPAPAELRLIIRPSCLYRRADCG